MNRQRLQKLFNEYNAKYFKGRLPEYHICVARRVGLAPISSYCDKDHHQIWILRGIENPAETLLHEMIHLATHNTHGPRFMATMRRLQSEGAQVVVPGWLTQTELRAHFLYWLRDFPDLSRDSIHHSVGLVLDDCRFRSSDGDVADFLWRHPWAKKLFVSCKRAALEDRKRAAGRPPRNP